MDENQKTVADRATPLAEDREAFRLRVFHQHRNLLLSIAYRMLGSWSDAEDMVQESFIRWRQSPDQNIQSPRAFLVTIVSRLCINHLQSARMQREEYFGEWLPEPVITSPLVEPSSGFPQVDDSLSMAFLVLLQRLTPTERAVFLLREVFDYDYAEIAPIVNTSEANCRQLLRRARQHIAEMRPRFDASPKESEQLLQAFMRATASGDLDSLVALLAPNVVFHSDGGGKAPALPQPIRGADPVGRAILNSFKTIVPKNLVRRLTQVNGRPGVVSYLDGRPFGVFTIDVADGFIQGLYFVSNPDKLARFQSLPKSPC
jgi:RNA polymerase sigma-70 factor (ECF subfamily)